MPYAKTSRQCIGCSCHSVAWDQGSDYDENEALACVALYADGTVAASLCGIIDPDATYGRVIEAELAAEARADALRLLAEAI